MLVNRFQLDNMRRGMPRNNTNGGGGGGGSQSTTATTTMDKRVAVDTGIGLSADSSTISINALDAGAIEKSLDFANKQFGTAALVANNAVIGALESNDRNTKSVLDFANKSFGTSALVANNAVIGAMETVDRGAARTAASFAESLDFANRSFGAATLVANNSVIGALESNDRNTKAVLDFANTQAGNSALVVNNATIGAFETVDRQAARSIDAVEKALAAVAGAGANSSETFTASLDFAKGVFDKGLSVLDTAGKQVEAQAGLVSKAWDNAKGAGEEKTMLMYVAVGAVALVAVATVWGRRA